MSAMLALAEDQELDVLAWIQFRKIPNFNSYFRCLLLIFVLIEFPLLK